MTTLWHLLCLAFLANVMLAEEYCSLIVKVVDLRNRETEAWVTIEEPNGRAIKKENEPGGVRFCDLGIKPVTITVGDPACNQVIVRNVSPRWGETVTTKILYDRAPCLVDQPPVAACHVLFRFKASEDKWVQGVSLKLDAPHKETLTGDQFGRIMVMFAAGQHLRATAAAEGYRPVEVSIPCTTENQRLERFVTLEKARE